eukprot:CAMPEP_0197860546 /NCGR_PEP_ID=MMETSP1438-20131217/35977_1 /TAXON_ID=1461541 /ORGANISM="Pterosperma sp., Strain CCMP1384" /LENGTH=715 /DNA_ID=CAMNT_0043477445 /DNA_START=100 /DNA_END=2247 /DNA_ORIENTATION=+
MPLLDSMCRKVGYGNLGTKKRRLTSFPASSSLSTRVVFGIGVVIVLLHAIIPQRWRGVDIDENRHSSRLEYEGLLDAASNPGDVPSPSGTSFFGLARSASSAAAAMTDFREDDEGDEDKEAQCAANIYSTFMLTKDGGLDPTRSLTVKRMSNVFNYNKKWQYSHMATLDVMVGPRMGKRSLLVAAWQAAPAVYGVGTTDSVQLAVEGLPDQRILYSFSSDGGYNWAAPSMAPTDIKGHNTHTPVWSPVLHYDKASGKLFLFYAQSRHCRRHTTPPTWDPGGDIKMMTSDSSTILDRINKGGGAKWSSPRVLLSQGTDDIPKVIANKIVVLTNGDWVLPFWREQPSSLHKGPKSDCAPEPPPTPPASPNKEDTKIDYSKGKSSAGVLISPDHGQTWQAYGTLKDSRTTLIEGSVVELEPRKANGPPRLMTFFRTNSGCMFQSESQDGGHTWQEATPLNFPNPNTKFHVVRIQPNNLLAIAFNDHKRNQFCKACRTHLHVAVSPDEGQSWRHVAAIEREEGMGMRIHYPTMVQAGTFLYIMYSRFYLDMGRCKASKTTSCIGLSSKNQGIRLVRLDLKELKKLPQLGLPFNNQRSVPNLDVLKGLVDHYLDTELSKVKRAPKLEHVKIMSNVRDAPWKTQCMRLASEYDMAHAGGYQYLQENKRFREYFKEQMAKKFPAPDLQTNSSITKAPTRSLLSSIMHQININYRRPGLNETM